MRRVFRASLYYFALFSLLFFGCSGDGSESKTASTENLTPLEEMRYSQYMVYGQQLYIQHCSNCHQEDGTGLGRVIPPLARADYMLEDISRTVCLIKYGLEGKIRVNGEDYHQKMPANEKLTALEIAQITTYITNTWGNEKGYLSVKDATKHLESCR